MHGSRLAEQIIFFAAVGETIFYQSAKCAVATLGFRRQFTFKTNFVYKIKIQLRFVIISEEVLRKKKQSAQTVRKLSYDQVVKTFSLAS